jgi:hypothetical protein
MEEPKLTESVKGSNHSRHGSEGHDELDHIHGDANIARKPVALSPERTKASFAHLDHKRILRKMDIRLIPMLAVLYLLAFLDRKLTIAFFASMSDGE